MNVCTAKIIQSFLGTIISTPKKKMNYAIRLVPYIYYRLRKRKTYY